jgi:hypothetical protein
MHFTREIKMKILTFIFLALLNISCKETPTQVNDSTIKYYSGEQSIDLNDDGKDDVRWELRYIGNEITTDAMFTVLPRNGSFLLYQSNYGNPLFEKGDTIRFSAIPPFYWSPYQSDLAANRTNTGQWYGNWVDKTAYMAIKISINDALYCGWVNITMDTLNQKIIFNYSDYSKIPESYFIISK